MDDIRPTLEHVPFFELFYPISTTDFYKSQWKFRRKIMSYKHLSDKYNKLIDFEADEDKIKKQILNSNEYICTTDFSKIWDIK
jgi:hypothetical protein